MEIFSKSQDNFQNFKWSETQNYSVYRSTDILWTPDNFHILQGHFRRLFDTGDNLPVGQNGVTGPHS